jgi:SAM-dependent methyltransferase
VATAPDPRATLRQLYRGLDGFPITPADERRVAGTKGGSATYGELLPTSTLRLLAQLELDRRDRFVDLGAGIGKVVLLAAMTTDVGAALGVELSTTRIAVAQQALARARQARVPGARRVRLLEADMMRCPLEDATVIYTCSTAFSSAFMRRLARRLAKLPKLRTLASLQDLDPHPAFELRETLRLDASWTRRTEVYLYSRKTQNPPSEASSLPSASESTRRL